jgi:hypothetical protein
MNSDDHPLPPNEISVRVFVPGEIAPKAYRFQRDVLVRDAAAKVAADCGIGIEDPTFQLGDDILDRDKTLEQAGVTPGAELELVGVGGGV